MFASKLKMFQVFKMNLKTGSFHYCQVFFSIDISAFPKIDPSHEEFTSDHTLNLRWYDPRLIFRDLNNKTTFNNLNPRDKKYIWKPQLSFLNALGPSTEEQSLHDEFSSVTLNKENKKYLDEDVSLPREGTFISSKHLIIMY